MFLKNKKIIGDVLLNMIASFLPLIILQLIILPQAAQHMEVSEYGLMLTIIGMITVIYMSFGNSLNNTRLLLDADYQEDNLSGDFNLILLWFISISTLLSVGCMHFYSRGAHIVDFILVSFIVALGVTREYFSVIFRLQLNFVKVVYYNLLLVIGYFIGYFIFSNFGGWEFIYLIGFSFSLFFVLRASPLLAEPLSRTTKFRSTASKAIILFASSLILSSINYIDRLLLFPLMGGAAVSIYYAASLFGKIIATGIAPINSVMLSYFARIKNLRGRDFFAILGSSSLLGIIGYFLCIALSRPILTIIYPQLVDASMQYIYITTATAIVSMICSVLSPTMLKFCNTKWQLVINGSNLIIYAVISLLLLSRFGLMGFCVGALIATLIKLILMLVVCLATIGVSTN